MSTSPYTAWPTASDVSSALAGRGQSLPSGFTGGGAVETAKRELYKITSLPFLAGASGDHLYTPNGTDTIILASWFSSVTAVRVGVTATESGTALTIGTDCFLLKNQDGKIWGIRLAYGGWFGLEESIKVTGVAGWSTTIPDDVFEAVLNYACALAVDQARAFGGVVTELKQGDLSVKYAESVEPGKWKEAALMNLQSVARAYRKVN